MSKNGINEKSRQWALESVGGLCLSCLSETGAEEYHGLRGMDHCDHRAENQTAGK